MTGGTEEFISVANGTDDDYRAVAMTSGALHRPTARLLSAAVSAVLLATTGPVVAAASAPGAAPDAHARLRHHPHYLRVATWNVGGILTDGKGGRRMRAGRRGGPSSSASCWRRLPWGSAVGPPT